MIVNVGASSVVHCSSNRHISKTKQERPIVTIEHYYEVGIADSVAAFKSSPYALLGDVLVSDTKYVQIIRPPVQLWRHDVRPQLLSTEQTVVSPPVL